VEADEVNCTGSLQAAGGDGLGGGGHMGHTGGGSGGRIQLCLVTGDTDDCETDVSLGDSCHPSSPTYDGTVYIGP